MSRAQIGILEQEFDRRVGHEVAGRSETEDADRPRREARRRARVESLPAQRLLLQPGAIGRAAVEQFDQRGIHQRGGVARIGPAACVQRRCDRREIAAAEGEPRERREADEGRRLRSATDTTVTPRFSKAEPTGQERASIGRSLRRETCFGLCAPAPARRRRDRPPDRAPACEICLPGPGPRSRLT